MKKIFNTASQIFDDEDFSEIDNEQEEEIKEEKKAEKKRIEQEVSKKIEQISNIRIPSDKEELLQLLSELSIQLKTNKWYRNRAEYGKIRNTVSDALFEKYQQCIYKLETLAPEPQILYYKDILKKQSRRRFFQKNTGLLKRVGLIALCLIIAIFFL